MECNLILAGVGGQGILTIAQAICLAVIRRGWHVKQSEVHGMSQRGGDVQAHLRFSDGPLYSDLVPRGKADMVLTVEPLEALRYVQYLSERGTIVASTAPFVNIPNYPPVEDVLAQIAEYPNHILVDAERLAKAAGSARAVNTVMLGAAASLLGLDMAEIEASISEMFGRKGAALVETNQRACRLGRNAANAYLDGLRRGASANEVRTWLEQLDPEQLEGAAGPVTDSLTGTTEQCTLSRAEAHGVGQILLDAYESGRRQLYEHEVYRLLELVGAVAPPKYYFVQKGEQLTPDQLERLGSDRVVLKVVSPDIVHKSDVGGVVFVPRDLDTVNREIKQLVTAQGTGGAHIEGVLVVECVDRSDAGFGQELFVGIRATREFGPIIAAGLGGVHTEYLASKMKPGLAVAKALAVDTTPEEFMTLFQQTAAYDMLAGRARGQQRIVSDGDLLRCFRAFIAVARRFCVDRGEEGPDVAEIEVNPFAFSHMRMIPLDGHGALAPATPALTPRPLTKMQALLEPKSIAVVGVSTKRANFGRIILNNVQDCGFSNDHLYVIKEGEKAVDGAKCVPSLNDLPEKLDLLVVATGADTIPDVIGQVVESRKVQSVILIPGGMGEKEGTEDLEAQVRQAIVDARRQADGGPIVVGGNCMGIRSRPGNYDTFFIPATKLDPRRSVPPRRAALISQSGAFIISRMSNLESLDPAIAVSLGNQIDVCVSDMLRTVGERDDIDCIGVYVEGFRELDGLAFVRAVEAVTAAGKLVVFYKAGRTAVGRAATAGHTASVAGDYDVCQTAVANAGALVTDTFKEFEQLMQLGTALHGKEVGGVRIGAMSNAGYETVGMADSVQGARYTVELPPLSEAATAALTKKLAAFKLDALVNVRNPLDLTPMANEDAYEACVQALVDDDQIDAVVVACVPLTPQMRTTADELAKGGSLADRLPKLLAASRKPVIAVLDSGRAYDAFEHQLREQAVPVFRSCDQAMRSLGRYLCHRTAQRPPQAGATLASARPAEPAPA